MRRIATPPIQYEVARMPKPRRKSEEEGRRTRTDGGTGSEAVGCESRRGGHGRTDGKN